MLKTREVLSLSGDESGEVMGVSWTFDSRIVYGSTKSGSPDVWLMNADGSNRTQLTIDSKSNFRPSTSREGSIVFVSRRTGQSQLWVMDQDGTHQRELAHDEAEETLPSVFPDGKSLAYVRFERGFPRVWRLSLDGKQKFLLNAHFASSPTVSPDGKFVACLYEETPIPLRHIAILPAAGGEPIKKFELPLDADTNTSIHWTVDGRAIAFVKNIDGVSNIWIQPIVGSAASPLTHFSSEKIFRFAWSQDGAKLAIERGVDVQDAVILRGSN
jgi:TolB protein